MAQPPTTTTTTTTTTANNNNSSNNTTATRNKTTTDTITHKASMPIPLTLLIAVSNTFANNTINNKCC